MSPIKVFWFHFFLVTRISWFHRIWLSSVFFLVCFQTRPWSSFLCAYLRYCLSSFIPQTSLYTSLCFFFCLLKEYKSLLFNKISHHNRNYFTTIKQRKIKYNWVFSVCMSFFFNYNLIWLFFIYVFALVSVVLPSVCEVLFVLYLLC